MGKNYKIKHIFLLLIIICAAAYLYLLAMVISGENNYSPTESDAVLILGHSLEDGNVPGSWLITRLEEGLRLYNEGYSRYIIVSGGAGPRDKIQVALSMEEWLLERDVSKENIIIETNASNTYENFTNVKEILKGTDVESIIIATSDFHIYRSMVIGTDYFENISASAALTPSGIRKSLALLKEPLSLVKFYLFHKEW